MSKTLLQIHFNFSGPFGEEMTQQLVGLAAFTCLNPKKRRRLILKNTLRV